MKFANPHDFLAIALMGYAFIFLANRGLDKMGGGDLKTRGSDAV